MKLTGGYVRFERLGAEVLAEKRGFLPKFDLRQRTPNQNDTEYEFSDTIPDNTADGSYRVNMISASVENISTAYNFGSDFKTEVKIEVKNPKKTPFAGIENIQVAPVK